MATTHRQRYRPRRDSRPCSGIESFIAGSLLLVLFLIAACSGGAPVDLQRTARVSVRAGDTVWDLARRHPVPGRDTASSVEVILALNGLDEGSLTPGQHLLVPGGHKDGAVAMR